MITTARDLRLHAKEVLETTLRGEDVIITYHGKPTARIVPYTAVPQKPQTDQHKLFGIWKDRSDLPDVEKHIRNMRKGREF